MNEIELIESEITSPLLRFVYKNLAQSRQRLQEGIIDVKRCNVEISTEKHKIQAVALDWMYNKTISAPPHQRKDYKKLNK